MRVEVHIDHYRSKVELNDYDDNDDDDDIRQYRLVINFHDKTKLCDTVCSMFVQDGRCWDPVEDFQKTDLKGIY
jgi:hypothetical protein